MKNEVQADAIDVRTERLANQAAPMGTLASQSGTAQAERTEITQVITSAGVSSIAGTANQIIASAPTGPVVLSTPQSIGTGSNPTFAGVISSTAGRFATKVTSPAQLTADVNDYNPGAGAFFRLDANSPWRITGIVAGADGAMIRFVNVGANAIDLRDQDVLSAAANQIITGTGGAVVLNSDESATLIYDSVTARWRVQR